jgi:hypothetical protein
MRNETSRIARQAWKFADKISMPHALGPLVRLGLFILSAGLAGVVALVALLHVAEVIP